MKKDKFNKFMKILGLNGLFLESGEAIKDLVLCYVVIRILIDKLINLPIVNYPQLARIFFALGITLVPIYYISKWINRIFPEENK
jgi:hypothetical protein